jgi:DNA-binding response OmpR family regulator
VQVKGRILVVDDDNALAEMLGIVLRGEGYEPVHCGDGEAALAAFRDVRPDLVLLDVMLPRINGFDVLRELRKRGVETPVIMLTAKGQVADKVAGLKLGADDYVTKPFDLEELLARVHAVLRRARPSVRLLQLGDVTIDFERLKATHGSDEIDLTHRDFEILKYLSERPNSIVSRNELLRAIWGYPDAANTRAVDHAIARLRKKIEDVPHKPRFIHTVHGDGYSLTVEVAPHSST